MVGGGKARLEFLVPTRGLIVQWKSALGKHCPAATVGELRTKYNPKKHDPASECDFVVTTSRSMSVVDYPSEILHKFGTVVVDESHERVYSPEAGVEQVVLGLYIIRGDNMCAAPARAPPPSTPTCRH